MQNKALSKLHLGKDSTFASEIYLLWLLIGEQYNSYIALSSNIEKLSQETVWIKIESSLNWAEFAF